MKALISRRLLLAATAAAVFAMAIVLLALSGFQPVAAENRDHAQPPLAEAGATSYAKARRVLINRVIKPTSLAADDTVIAFRWKKPLKKGTVIAPFRKRGKSVRLKSKAWFFWIDDDPKAQFEHENRFVLIDSRSGKVRVINSNWWPTVNGRNPYLSTQKYWSKGNWAYGNVTPPTAAASAGFAGASAASTTPVASARFPAIPHTAASTPECAVLIAGSDHAKAGFLDDVDGMERALTALGHTTTKIKPPAKNGKTEFEAAVKAAITDGCKNVLLYLAGHGSKESVDMGAGQYTAADMKKLIEANPTTTFKVVIQACKSGSWVEPLKDKVEIIETATDSTKKSYSANPDGPADPNPADKGSEFTSGLVEDLELIKTSPAAQLQVQVCMMGTPPFFTPRPLLVCQLEIAYQSALAKDEDAASGKAAPQKYSK